MGCDITVAQLCLDRQSLDRVLISLASLSSLERRHPEPGSLGTLLQVTQESEHPSGLSTHAWTLQAHTHCHNIILARQGCGVVL